MKFYVLFADYGCDGCTGPLEVTTRLERVEEWKKESVPWNSAEDFELEEGE